MIRSNRRSRPKQWSVTGREYQPSLRLRLGRPFRTPEREAAQAASLGRRQIFTLLLQLFYTRLTILKLLGVCSPYRHSRMKLRNKGPLYRSIWSAIGFSVVLTALMPPAMSRGVLAAAQAEPEAPNAP